MVLSCAKNFIDYGVPFYAVEASEEIGGIWNIMNERSAIYESAHTISSKSNTEFADFPIKHQADYPSHYVMKEYLDDYTSFFKLKRHYLLGVEVLNVKKNGNGWQVCKTSMVSFSTMFDFCPKVPGTKWRYSGVLSI